ncbi:hypothetical protein G7Y89_g14954 [Cudoniella acicularis]|uniref:Heterokaryon incompatibility domain-containing protein n=1 Tax=Cudoniella acicularis TaxID=354080 RepID=A0A8H4QWY3_9HELO|nr:hypothetical protein G7Y89_g14954 [Cudoniella acicularis]
MPLRLIEISRVDDRWQLKINTNTKEKTAKYCALSYCWDPLQSTSFRLRVNTLDTLKINIHWTQLSKTIQDAVTTTYELSMRYLWADSFCILQYNEEDKAHEISLMPQIYGQATVTIVASRSEASDAGYLHSRPKLCESFQIPFRSSAGELGFVYLLEAKEAHNYYKSEPLDLRAWAMQERLLSPRVLEFGTSQTRWKRRENTAGHSDGWISGTG